MRILCGLSIYFTFAATSLALSKTLRRSFSLQRSLSMLSAVPSANVDLISKNSDSAYEFSGVDLGAVLKSHKKAILFAVPGAFTPTCSAKHLPGFVQNVENLKSKGVEAVYCLSVNDKYVMRAWAEATEGCKDSGIILVADGNGDFTKAMGLSKDATGSKMGIRCTRFAAIIEEGNISSLQVDEQGFEKSSAENILSLL
mmetsp:Transcript_23255/g.31855  ORF Transcript_23255/g.31855 Transcript_23255/m.31855 type:complete len:199 (-) Transcript_23255:68-664(-)